MHCSALLEGFLCFLPCTVAVLPSWQSKLCPSAHKDFAFPWNCRQKIAQGIGLAVPQSTRGFLSRTEQDIVVAKIFRATREATSGRTIVVNVREQCLERINVSVPDTTLRKVGKGTGVLFDLLAQVADSAL